MPAQANGHGKPGPARTLLAALPFLAWFATLWWLSSGPGRLPGNQLIPHFDKLAHFAFFFLGACLLHLPLATATRLTPTRRTLVIIATLAAVGALDEFHQSFVPQRSGNDPADLTADILGATTAACILHKRLTRR